MKDVVLELLEATEVLVEPDTAQLLIGMHADLPSPVKPDLQVHVCVEGPVCVQAAFMWQLLVSSLSQGLTSLHSTPVPS
jgi:hypothetical protein